MSADWLPILASPKDLNKNLGKSGTFTFSSIVFDKLISSASVSMQLWPKSIPASDPFYTYISSQINGFNEASSLLGKEFSARIILAAGKARATNAAVRIPAANIFIYAASHLGFKQSSKASTIKNGERAKQFLIRRGMPSSASAILHKALHTLCINTLINVATFAYSGGTQIILVPTNAKDTKLLNIYEKSLYHSKRSPSEECNDAASNHVASYMRTVPKKRFFSNASRKAIFKLIDKNCSISSYRYALKEIVADGLANGFFSDYCDPASCDSRIFARGHSLQFMPGWLRKALFPNWFELDFSNMHLSILNSKANLGLDLSSSIWEQILSNWQSEIKKIKQTLSSEDFCDEIDIPWLVKLFTSSMNKGSSCSFRLTSNIDNMHEIKKALKKSLYSLQFGMDKSSAKRQFTLDLVNAGFLNSEVALLGNLWSSTTVLERIQSGVETYCRSNSIGVSKLAIQCQQKETEIVKHIYDIASKYKRSDLCITVHSHDGVSVWARNPQIANGFYAKCRAHTSNHLKKENIWSRLEAKFLPDISDQQTQCSHSYPVNRELTMCNPGIKCAMRIPPATGPP